MKIIEELNYENENYMPVLINEKWQLAYLNSCPEYQMNSIKKLDIHYKTDEAFILLEGQAILIAAEIISDDNITFDLIDMKKGVTYNIPKKVWHNIILSKKTRICIVEDANTHLKDYQFYYLSGKYIDKLHNDIHALTERTRL